MLDVDHIASQVKLNCNISDAKYWGLYSPCGLLLRLRDLYKVEKGSEPWKTVSHGDIGDWIEKREKLWRELGSYDFHKIEIDGRRYRPFDVKGINSVLQEHGFLYGAGYGNMLKPVFMLAELSRGYKKERFDIYIAGRETARDLSTSPAMLQGNTIIIRQETMRLFLWGKFEEMSSRKRAGLLSHAFSEYGASRETAAKLSPEEIKRLFAEITHKEVSSYVYHEIGEASQRRLLGKWWKELLLRLPYSRAELFLRGLKDVLSDTCNSGMLAHIIDNRKAGSLAFYVALLGGFRKSIFPDIIEAFEGHRIKQDWSCIEEARVEGYRKARGYIKTLKGIVQKGKVTPKKIEKGLISEIGI
jgi:hypothetical protein